MTDRPSLSTIQWEPEFKKTALRYHIIGCWVAIIVNPLWAVSDYFSVPDQWQFFLILRLGVSVLTLLALLFRKPLKLSPELLIMVPFLGISLQGAYQYSVMEVEAVRQFTFALIALFLAAGMLVLWRWWYSLIVVGTTIAAQILFFSFLSPLTTQELIQNGGLLAATGALLSILLIQTRYTLTRREIKARLALSESNNKLKKQKQVIEEKNKAITDSIRYAQTIQEAILPDEEEMGRHLGSFFVFFKPLELVSGDFYWFNHHHIDKTHYRFIAAIDCTGHGVPGAFMSMIGNELLNKIIMEYQETQPRHILKKLDEGVVQALKQRNSKNNTNDGMDLSLCTIDPQAKKLYFAGAKNPMYLCSNGELKELKGSHFPIGGDLKADKSFEQKEYAYQPGDTFYLFSDGYPDQFGGPKGKKFRYKRLRKLLKDIHQKPMGDQEKIVASRFEEWKGDEAQIDDVLLMGIRL